MSAYQAKWANRYAEPGSFGAMLRERRIARGLRQDELARLAGVHPNTVCMLEWGRSKGTTETRDRLEKVLGDGKVNDGN